MGFDWIVALWRSARVVFRTLWRVTRQLFHEFTGTLFALFSIYGITAAYRQWNHSRVMWVVALAIVYSVVMAVFSFFAFRSARRVR